MTEEQTVAMHDAIVGAWLAGARAVHEEWAKADEGQRFYLSRDHEPDFTEAAHDYAASNSPTTNGEAARIPAAEGMIERAARALRKVHNQMTVEQLQGGMDKDLIRAQAAIAALSALLIPATGELEKALRKAAARLRLASDGPEDKATIRKWSDEALAATKDDLTEQGEK